MRRPVSRGFKVVLSLLGLITMGAIAALLAEAMHDGPRVVNVSDSVQVTQDIPYGRVDRQSLYLDVYQSRSWTIGTRPALLLIHGGGWIEGDKTSERDLATLLVPKGFVAFAINYRLLRGTQDGYPAQILDVRRAVRWIRLHAPDYGVDPDRIGAVGWSAGGQLAALLGATDAIDPADPASDEFSSQVKCVVETAGPTDFTDPESPPVGPSLSHVIPALFERSRAVCPDIFRAASPTLQVNAHSAPTLIVHGSADPIVPIDQAHRLDRALRAVGVEVRLLEFAGEGHGFTQGQNNQIWLDTAATFLIDHLNP